MSTNTTPVTICFEESESIADFGTKKTTYRVCINQVWTSVSQVKTATTRSVSPSAGVVWMRIVELSLPIGTEIERCIEAPMQARHGNTFDALIGKSNARKRSYRCERFVVQAGGRLSRASSRMPPR